MDDLMIGSWQRNIIKDRVGRPPKAGKNPGLGPYRQRCQEIDNRSLPSGTLCLVLGVLRVCTRIRESMCLILQCNKMPCYIHSVVCIWWFIKHNNGPHRKWCFLIMEVIMGHSENNNGDEHSQNNLSSLIYFPIDLLFSSRLNRWLD